MLILPLLLATLTQPLWPSAEVMPDICSNQVAKRAMPYLEWCDAPTTNRKDVCVILISGGSYQCTCDGPAFKKFEQRLLAEGIHCVYLWYRYPRPEGLPIYQTAWEDGQRAVRLVRAAAKERGFDPEKIGVMGCSAGSHLSTLLATSSQTPAYAKVDDIDEIPCHLNFALTHCVAYALDDGLLGKNVNGGVGAKLSDVFKFDAKTCPMCLMHGGLDPYSPLGSTQIYRQLRRMKIPAELHLDANRHHGVCRIERFDRAIEFLRQLGFLGKVAAEEEVTRRFDGSGRARAWRENLWPAGKMPNPQAQQCEPYLEWHLPTKLTSTAIQICFSGGAYARNTPDGQEVAPVRMFLNDRGVTVVTVKYRTPRPQGLPKHLTAWQDLQRAIRMVKAEAPALGLDPNRVGIMGCSAGGHLTLMGALSSLTPAYAPIDAIDAISPSVNWAVAFYPAYVLSDGPEDVPNTTGGNDDSAVLVDDFKFDAKSCPMLFLHGDADVWAAMNSVKTWEKLRELGVQCDLHTFALRSHCFQYTATPGTGSYTYLDRIWDFCNQEGRFQASMADRIRRAGLATNGYFTALEQVGEWLRVSFVLQPSAKSYIRCELALPPASKWDGRLWGHGNGGWAGAVLCLKGMDGDYSAHIQCDGGTSKTPFPNAVPEDPEICRDFSDRAIHLMTVEAKRIINAAYGRPAAHSYFTGASTGGGQAFSEVSRHPEDYEGVIAEVPAISRAARMVHAWKFARLWRDGAKWFSAAEMRAIREAELAYFAKTDPEWAHGNFILNPRPTPEKLDGCWAEIVKRCPQVADREAIWRELFKPVMAEGKELSPGLYLGAEFGMPGSFVYDAYYGHPKNLADITEAQMREFYENRTMNFDDPDLSAFRDRGGKVITFAGFEDAAVLASPMDAYYDAVCDKMGGVDAVQKFFLHYDVPGRSHGVQGAPAGSGQIGIAPEISDKLMAWVEKGIAPTQMEFTWPGRAKRISVSPYPANEVKLLPPTPGEAKYAAAIRKAEGEWLGADVTAANGDFALKFDGQAVAVKRMESRPDILERQGTLGNFRITTKTAAYLTENATVMKVTVENLGKSAATLTVTREGTSASAWSLNDATAAKITLKPGAKRNFLTGFAYDPSAAQREFIRGKIAEDGDGIMIRSHNSFMYRLNQQ